ncbi:hypothetical protein [Kitasatospora griseola]|uniref:hypothetical protein n=1 Tax=Kitasatospora griseola TaxID=2064 RepID=UPI00069627EE|nr:hypothetical protein [Kitasatospora griseola]
MNTTVTLGGVVVGVALHIREFAPAAWATLFKKGASDMPAPAAGSKFNIRNHVPFLAGDAIGVLAISCPGGVIGNVAGKMLGFSNALGDKVLSSGVGGSTVAATRNAAHVMDQGGAAIVVLLVFTAFVLRKALPKPQRRELATGMWSGATLGLSSAASGLAAAALVPVAEQLGHALGGSV